MSSSRLRHKHCHKIVMQNDSAPSSKIHWKLTIHFVAFKERSVYLKLVNTDERGATYCMINSGRLAHFNRFLAVEGPTAQNYLNFYLISQNSALLASYQVLVPIETSRNMRLNLWHFPSDRRCFKPYCKSGGTEISSKPSFASEWQNELWLVESRKHLTLYDLCDCSFINGKRQRAN